MKKYLVAISVTFISAFASAQSAFVKGYVLNAAGDTLMGEVKTNPKKEQEAYIKVLFRDATGVQKNYKPDKIKAYGFNDQNFISIDQDGEPLFYRVVSQGEINFYKILFQTVRMNEISYEAEYYISGPDKKKLVVVKETKFKKQISEWMKDNPEFVNAYADEKKFDPQKAAEVINQYNNWKKNK